MPIEEIITAFLKEGLFAGLCVAVLFWFLKDAKEREQYNRKVYEDWTEEFNETQDLLKTVQGKLELLEKTGSVGNLEMGEIKTSLRVIESLLSRNTRDRR